MAGTGVWVRLLERSRVRLTKDPDMNRVVSRLIKRGVFSIPEERQLASAVDASERTDLLIDKLSKEPEAFREFCMTLEECAPHLLSEFLFDCGDVFGSDSEQDTQALQLGFELALKERDVAVREHARAAEDLVEARRKLDVLQVERDRAVSSLENLRLDKPANPKRFDGNTRTSGSSLRRTSQDSDPQVVEEGGDNVVWQIHKVSLQRVANYGFGIAVSGGRDSPHFANGDPSIAISDVLKAGPAEGKLQLNDRIISVNGISLENVSHSTAIQVLKNSGDVVHLVVRRRVIMPAAVEKETPPLKVTLTKKNKKDEFGLVLGCRYYIRDLLPDSLAAQDGGLKLGDTVLKINNTPLEGLSLPDVKKLLEKSKDRLQLIVSKTQSDDRPRHQSNPSRIDEGYATFRPPTDKDDINVYRPSIRSEEDLYPGELPPGVYPSSGHAHFDGRYVYDHEAPPRPPPPSGFPRDGPHSPGRELLRADDFYGPPQRDGYYSDQDMNGYRGHPDEDVFARQHHDERYVGMRSDVRLDIRRVVFEKDRQKGLGLRLAGGNATGIFIASVQPGSAAEAEGLVEGDQILQANGLDIVGLTREEAVAHLTSLEGQVTLLVQYKKEDYDSIMASHEAGDSFYIRTHFNYQPSDNSGEHAFKVGDIFHIKDTLFRGVGGSWLAIRVGPNGEELKKGTIPNKKKAEVLASTQENSSSKETFPNKGRGSLFKRKSARRAKSLGKDHWEEVIFSGLSTKFPPYERVVLRDPAFVRPVVVFGAIADVARDKLLSEHPERFESPQSEKGVENDPKKGKTGIIRFGAIREAMNHQKHCVLDVTPYHVDRLNYAQYYPIVIFLRGENKQAIKEVRSRWRGGTGTNKNPKKLQEHNERMENLYAHLFTGTINHTSTDAWFPKLVEMIESQQRRPVWMSEKKPEEDFNDDFMFPMPNRMSLAGSPESELDLGRPSDDLDTSPMQKKRLVRSSSDPSINTADRVPGIPPYPAPPGYGNRKVPPFVRDDYDDYRHPRFQDRDGDWQMHPDDRYYPHPHHHLPDGGWSSQSHLHQPPPPQQQPYPLRSRSNIDVYATITPSERVRNRVSDDHFQGGYDEFGPHRDRLPLEDPYRMAGLRQPGPPHDPQMPVGPEHRGYNDSSSHDSDSYSRYVSSPANKHDDSKLRDKFGSLQVGSRERSPQTHDPYRFTRSTANPVSGANIDRAKLSDLSARYRREDKQKQPVSKAGAVSSPTGPGVPPEPGRSSLKKKEPPPVPAKTYSLKEVGMDLEEIKARNYENSNRGYNYSEVVFPPPPSQQPPSDGRLHLDHPPTQKAVDSPYEYISVRPQNRQPPLPPQRGENPPPLPREEYQEEMVSGSYEVQPSSRAFANSIYMDHREVDRVRSGEAEREPPMRDMPGYTRPRTDDEQLRDLQRNRSRLKSDSRLNDRAKSETRLNDRGDRWSKYKSWDNEKEGQKTFDAYKKLITPGFYGPRKNMSKSHDELREEASAAERNAPPRPPPQRGDSRSAFEAYRKPFGGSTPHVDDVRTATVKAEDLIPLSRASVSKPPPPPSPPPPPPPPPPASYEMSYHHDKPLPPPPPPPPAVPQSSKNLASQPSKFPQDQPSKISQSQASKIPQKMTTSAAKKSNTASTPASTSLPPSRLPLKRMENAAGPDVLKSATSAAQAALVKAKTDSVVAAKSASLFSSQQKPVPQSTKLKSTDVPKLSVASKAAAYSQKMDASKQSSDLVSKNRTKEAKSDSKLNMDLFPKTKGKGPKSESSPTATLFSSTDAKGPKSEPSPTATSFSKTNTKGPNSDSSPFSPSAPSTHSGGGHNGAKRANSSSEEKLPSPPPSSVLNSQQNPTSPTSPTKSQPPARPPPLKNLPPPPPPPPPAPPLRVTPLPPVVIDEDANKTSEEPLSNGKTPPRRLSGTNGKSSENGEENGDDSVETSESASTPDTVISVPFRRETEEGQTVVATARGVFSSEGGVLESKETGVSIVIPPGALPEGVEQEIYFKVCSGNSILPPLDEDKGETLLSPLVMCGPHGLQFKKPVELKLPHSASVNPESWSFALKSSDSPSGQPTQWQNMTLAGSEGVAQGRVNQSSVSVLVDHF